MFVLAKVASRLSKYRLLLRNLDHEEVIDCVNGIRYDSNNASIQGYASGLQRLVELIS
jgi:hypothetical protein